MITDTRTIDAQYPYQPLCNDKMLIMMMGLPRSGKSTWALRQNIPIVDLDAIRLVMTGQRWYGPIEHEVHAIARTMIRALFVAGHNYVILDITSTTRKQRDEFLSSSDVPWARSVMAIDTDIQVCKQRAEKTYPILVDVIDWMHENLQPLEDSENIDIWGYIKNGETIIRPRQFITRISQDPEATRLVEGAGRTS